MTKSNIKILFEIKQFAHKTHLLDLQILIFNVLFTRMHFLIKKVPN